MTASPMSIIRSESKNMEEENCHRLLCEKASWSSCLKTEKCIYESPASSTNQGLLPRAGEHTLGEVTRFENPHEYYVDLSQKLWDMKEKLLHEHSMK